MDDLISNTTEERISYRYEEIIFTKDLQNGKKKTTGLLGKHTKQNYLPRKRAV